MTCPDCKRETAAGLRAALAERDRRIAELEDWQRRAVIHIRDYRACAVWDWDRKMRDMIENLLKEAAR